MNENIKATHHHTDMVNRAMQEQLPEDAKAAFMGYKYSAHPFGPAKAV